MRIPQRFTKEKDAIAAMSVFTPVRKFALLSLCLSVLLLLAACSGTKSSSISVSQTPTITASASPTSVSSGQPSTLSWTTTNADSVSIDNGIGKQAQSGSVSVKPGATTTYTLVASSASSGLTATTTVMISVATPPLGLPTISLLATPLTITAGQSVTLSFTTTNTTTVSIDNGVGVVTSPATVTPNTTTTYTATATGPGGTATATATVTVNPAPGSISVITQHNDLTRQGANVNETFLTPANVNAVKFGKRFAYPVDGQIYGQPLYVPNLTINGAAHNAVFVTTENDSVYAFDADGGGTLWKKSMGAAQSNTNDPDGVGPILGILSTPVIDLNSATLYLVATTSGRVMTLHALDLSTGTDKVPATVITASVAGTGQDSVGGIVRMQASCYQRSALTLANSRVYMAFSHCNHGWILSYDANTLQQKEVLNTSPDGVGATIWMGGAGPVVDELGNLYLITSDDIGSSAPSSNDFPDAFLKLTPDLKVLSSFIPSNEQFLRTNDADLGSGAPVLVPHNSPFPHELIGGGKDGRVFVVNGDNLGGYNPNGQDAVVQTIQTGTQQFDNIWGAPAYWNGVLYYHTEADVLKAYGWSGSALTAGPFAKSTKTYLVHGASPSVSSNGTTNGIVWDVEDSAYDADVTVAGPAILHAYDASNISKELYNSTQAANGRDTAGKACKFSVPTIADGKVFIPTSNELDIYGLL